jgi:hypothetical protein
MACKLASAPSPHLESEFRPSRNPKNDSTSKNHALSPQTFARLQTHAVPLVDNIESVINRLVDYYEAKSGAPAPAAASEGEGAHEQAREFAPTTPPNLTHTKVLSVELCGKRLDHSQTNWNSLLVATIREAKLRTKSADELKQLVMVNFVNAEKNEDGYRFVSDIGISVQQQDANAAWRAACHIAQQLRIPLLVTFAWRQKEGAAFPGLIGHLSVSTQQRRKLPS